MRLRVWSLPEPQEGDSEGFEQTRERIRLMILKGYTFHITVTLGLLFLVYNSCVMNVCVCVCVYIYIHTHRIQVLCLWRILPNK